MALVSAVTCPSSPHVENPHPLLPGRQFRPQRSREDRRRDRCCPSMYQAQWHAMRSFTRDKSVTQQRLSRGIVRRIASYARPYRLDLVIFLTLTALSAVIAVTVPLLLQT